MEPLAVMTNGLTRRFGARLVVDQVDLHVPAGSIYGLLGPNGAGKTTTLRLLLGLLRPSVGTITIGGLAMPAQRRAVLRRVGALIESPALYPHLSGRENLEQRRRRLGLAPAAVTEALSLVQLERDAERLVRHYSLGMRQRLGLALALLGQPALLVLDEPTNGLDPAGIQELRAFIRTLPARLGATVLLSSHLLHEVAQVATHVGVLHRGRLAAQGPLAEVQAREAAVVELGVDQPAAARTLLERAGYTVTGTGEGRLRVGAARDTDIAALNRLLVQAWISVVHLARPAGALETRFLALTDEAAEGGAP